MGIGQTRTSDNLLYILDSVVTFAWEGLIRKGNFHILKKNKGLYHISRRRNIPRNLRIGQCLCLLRELALVVPSGCWFLGQSIPLEDTYQKLAKVDSVSIKRTHSLSVGLSGNARIETIRIGLVPWPISEIRTASTKPGRDC